MEPGALVSHFIYLEHSIHCTSYKETPLTFCRFYQHADSLHIRQTRARGREYDNSHMPAVTLRDLVSDGVLVGQVLIVEQVLPALGLVEVSYLG